MDSPNLYYLANRPVSDAWAIMAGYALRPFWHIKHRRISVGVRLLPRVLASIPVSLVAMVSGPLAYRPHKRRPTSPAHP
jgi:hypothetical protein